MFRARILGTLGQLDEMESTTHHEVIPHLQEIAPRTRINPEARFIDNGKILTCGGITAGIDLSLHIVGKLFGGAVKDKTTRLHGVRGMAKEIEAATTVAVHGCGRHFSRGDV